MKRYDKHRVTEKAVIRGPILLTVTLACVAFIDPSRADASEPVAFSALEDILTAENHPRLYDTEEAAHAFYQNAPKGTVAITTWSESITEYFTQAPEYSLLWLDGNPKDIDSGEVNPTIGSVTIDYSSLPDSIDIDTAVEYAQTFIPDNIYKENGKKEKYIAFGETLDPKRKVCWVIFYDTVSSDYEGRDLGLEFYGDSEKSVKMSFTEFNDNRKPYGNYALVDWDTPIDNVSISDDGIVTISGVAALTKDNATPMIATANVNVRSGPSTDADKLGTLSQGETVEAGVDENGWTPILYGAGIGYVSSQYLAMAPPLTSTTEAHEANEQPPQTAPAVQYVCNTNTKKFHKPTCNSVKQMKEANRMDTELSRDELIAQGYEPCGNCRP